MFDVAIVGSGPAGAACAAVCARAGVRTLLLEREKFPREKVCGDCLNPSCFPVLQRLGIAERVRALPHGKLRRVDFIAIAGHTISIDLPPDTEIAVKRSLFDELLMTCAREAGAEVRDGAVVSGITPPTSMSGGWTIAVAGSPIVARVLVAADGRNSTVARLLGLLPAPERERVALQTHLPLPKNFGERVVLQLLPHGYSGQAPVGNDELNLCLVGKPEKMPALRAWAEMIFGISPNHTWRTITPLRRAAISPAHPKLFLIGDAARVVEPFTGEGIFYALRSGELAADAIISNRDDYALAHEKLYRGRLWINRIARTAVLSPRATSLLLRSGVMNASVLRRLTTKVVSA
ncbi:MAG: NAD(P)/FAD-dependent oxidoreductase [Chthoniobacterales bacterium]